MTTKTYPLSAIQDEEEMTTKTKPIAYLMENDESKWLDWEPDPCADFITPLYKEKWKVAK